MGAGGEFIDQELLDAELPTLSAAQDPKASVVSVLLSALSSDLSFCVVQKRGDAPRLP